MNLNILYFASVKESLNCEQETLDCDNVVTVSDLIEILSQRGPNWESLLRDNQILVAVNQTISPTSTQLNADDEVAFFPPVTGG